MTLEVVRSIHHAAGPDHPVLIKLNSEDIAKDGFSVHLKLASITTGKQRDNHQNRQLERQFELARNGPFIP